MWVAPATHITHVAKPSAEPELDLALRGLGRVGPVHDVRPGLEGEVAADGARDGLLDGVGAAGDLAEGGDGAGALDDHGRHGCRGDEGDQLLVEALALVLGVVLLGETTVDRLQLQRHEAQALALDARHDLPDQAALHAVGLDQHQGALVHVVPLMSLSSPSPGRVASGLSPPGAPTAPGAAAPRGASTASPPTRGRTRPRVHRATARRSSRVASAPAGPAPAAGPRASRTARWRRPCPGSGPPPRRSSAVSGRPRPCP